MSVEVTGGDIVSGSVSILRSSRLLGLDIARSIAIMGMVLVNYTLVMKAMIPLGCCWQPKLSRAGRHSALLWCLDLGCNPIAFRFQLGIVSGPWPLIDYVLLFTVDYEIGWDWDTLEYAEFWRPDGFVRNIFTTDSTQSPLGWVSSCWECGSAGST